MMVRLLGLEQASAVLGSGSYDNMPSGALSLEKLEEQGTNNQTCHVSLPPVASYYDEIA
jgi:hypothetical protein